MSKGRYDETFTGEDANTQLNTYFYDSCTAYAKGISHNLSTEYHYSDVLPTSTQRQFNIICLLNDSPSAAADILNPPGFSSLDPGLDMNVTSTLFPAVSSVPSAGGALQ